ncbi:hypothetical protein G9A89_006539 [Geosiphon pyriformis]|nr:hypothetical protein G9A89_006539 [Geosiphon pyriformis]
MAYAPIAKIEKFTDKEDNMQVVLQAIPYFFQNTANLWYQSLANKSQNFNTFKLEFLQYFNNNNSINYLANTFTTIKQELKQYMFATIMVNKDTLELVAEFIAILHNQKINTETLIVTANLLTTNLSAFSTSSLSTAASTYLLTAASNNLSAKSYSYLTKLRVSNNYASTNSQFLNSILRIITNYLSLLVTLEDAIFNNLKARQKQPLTNNILPATITKNESLTAIFSFELEEPVKMLLFNRTALESKFMTAIDKASGTTNYVSLVESSYLTKKYGMTFLVEEEHAMYCVNTQSSSATG